MKKNEAGRAMAKAHRAALLLAQAQDLMKEAAELTGPSGIGHEDYRHWVHQIGELLSCDHDEAGIGPTLTKLAKQNPPKVKTYPHRRSDGTVVNVSIPED